MIKAFLDDWLFYLALWASITALIFVTSWYAKIPDAHFSNATGECVRVVNHDRDAFYTCGSLPDRYNHVWVE